VDTEQPALLQAPTAAAPSSWLRPVWRDPHTRACMTSRDGGQGRAPFDSFNLRAGIGDDEARVADNQAVLKAVCGITPVWLNQVHGARVVRLQPQDAAPGAPVHAADASVSTVAGLACAVQVADCLPVLMSARGRAVAAAHAGWRGLSLGIVEATLLAVCEAAGCEPAEVEVWLGACIGPRRFEVGADVLEAFGASPAPAAVASSQRFVSRGPDHPGKWLADLPGLASDRLRAAGVTRLGAAGLCTVEERSRFFSFRRDGLTGRMAALVWLERG
jgi:polyphenol oxidase